MLRDENGWHRLIISRITPDHAGQYTIITRNTAGEARSTATLTVNPPVPVKPVTPIREPQGFTQSTTQVIKDSEWITVNIN